MGPDVLSPHLTRLGLPGHAAVVPVVKFLGGGACWTSIATQNLDQHSGKT